MRDFIKSQIGVNPVMDWLDDCELQVNTHDHSPYFWRSVKETTDEPIIKDEPDWIEEHAELIGSSGWNAIDQVSVFAGVDIDAKDHAVGCDTSTIEDIDAKVSTLKYAQLQKSKGGNGRHIFGKFVRPLPAKTRAEHRLNSERFVRQLEADTGLVLIGKNKLADCFGGINWLWARSRNENSFAVVSAATECLPDELPSVVPARKLFTGSNDVPQDAPKELILALNKLGCAAIWQPDLGCLHTHPYGLKLVHKERNLPGRFETVSEGRNLSQPSVFYYPTGPWSGRVVRFGRGCKEHPSWNHGEWTSCEFGTPLSFADSCKFHGGVLTEGGEYVLLLAKAAEVVFDVTCSRPTVPGDRPATISKTDSGIVIDVEKVKGEKCPEGFRKHKRGWRLFVGAEVSINGQVYCGVRHGAANEWFTHLNDQLIARSKSDCISALSHKNDTKSVMKAISKAAANPTPIVKVPYKGQLHEGCLNPDAPQFCCKPQTTPATRDQFPTWATMFDHVGAYLTEYLTTGWGAGHGIDGPRYIEIWLAIALRTPEVRLPFLAMFGDQLSGKSSFATAINVLVPGGVYQAAKQLRTDDKFDANLEGMPFVFVDEVNLSQQTKFEYLKTWITESHGTVRAMYQAPRRVTNYTHWIQAVNRVEFLPVFDDVSRITALRLDVIPREKRINSDDFKARLRAEAPAVLRYLFDLPLPPGDGRLAIPAIQTDLKDVARSMTDDPMVEVVKGFVTEHCREGEGIRLKELRKAFEESSGTSIKQNALAALLTNCGYTVKTRKGYPYLVGFEVTAC